jgi:hypothetical protein
MSKRIMGADILFRWFVNELLDTALLVLSPTVNAIGNVIGIRGGAVVILLKGVRRTVLVPQVRLTGASHLAFGFPSTLR